MHQQSFNTTAVTALMQSYERLLQSRQSITLSEQLTPVSCEHGSVVTVSLNQILIEQTEVEIPRVQAKLKAGSTIVAMPLVTVDVLEGQRYYLLRDGNHSLIARALKGESQFELRLEDPTSYIKFFGDGEIKKSIDTVIKRGGALPKLVSNFSIG